MDLYVWISFYLKMFIKITHISEQVSLNKLLPTYNLTNTENHTHLYSSNNEDEH